MSNFSSKQLQPIGIKSIQASFIILFSLLTLTLASCGGGSSEAPEGSKFNPNLSFATTLEINEGDSATIIKTA